MLRDRQDDRRAEGVRAGVRLRLLDRVLRAGGEGEWRRRRPSRRLGSGPLDPRPRHLAALGLGDVVTYHNGEAVEALTRSTDGPFDIIFLDIEKRDYPKALPAIESRLREGGVLIVDNMIWNNRVFDPKDQAPDTEGVRALTRSLTTTRGWITSIIPIRDGLMVALRT